MFQSYTICRCALRSFIYGSKRLSFSTYASSITTIGGHLNVLQLKSRGLLRLTGKDTASFLQGIITNDLECFTLHSCHSLYAMMLNVQGRVLYDLILYNVKNSPEEAQEILMECDAAVIGDIMNTLKMYKIRKKVDISNVSDCYNIWTIFPDELPTSNYLSAQPSPILKSDQRAIILASDPRLKALGYRCILPDTNDVTSIVENIDLVKDGDAYAKHRYRFGVAEGINDLHPGKCLPLESNLVFLNGVNFSKGCYVGQELTARTHHTGVTRKRIMPIIFKNDLDSSTLNFDDSIKSESGKAAGKYRNGVGKFGIGLIRLSEGKKTLRVENKDKTVVQTKAIRPFWWPDNVQFASIS